LRHRGISTYVETYLLIGVVLLGSSLVYVAASRYASTLQGPAISVSDLTIRQGANWAVEKFVVANTGSMTGSRLVVATSGVAPGTTYCYVVSDAISRATLASSCPTMATMPASASISATLRPGSSAVVQFSMAGVAFALGSWVTVVVGTANGAQVSATSQVVPA
jgi:hypothetical protein